jgi:RNA polymerase sigma-70 factor (family 1)
MINMLNNDFNEGFDSLYLKYYQLIYGNVFKFVKNKEESQDILQDVFAALWESRQNIRKEQSVSGWLFVISFNKSVNHIKKKLRHSAAQDKVVSIYSSHYEDRDDPFDEHYQILQHAIGELSPQKQKVFKLCKLEGKSYEEAAKLLNISRHTVKEYLSLAMYSVKDAFKTTTYSSGYY